MAKPDGYCTPEKSPDRRTDRLPHLIQKNLLQEKRSVHNLFQDIKIGAAAEELLFWNWGNSCWVRQQRLLLPFFTMQNRNVHDMKKKKKPPASPAGDPLRCPSLTWGLRPALSSPQFSKLAAITAAATTSLSGPPHNSSSSSKMLPLFVQSEQATSCTGQRGEVP